METSPWKWAVPEQQARRCGWGGEVCPAGRACPGLGPPSGSCSGRGATGAGRVCGAVPGSESVLVPSLDGVLGETSGAGWAEPRLAHLSVWWGQISALCGEGLCSHPPARGHVGPAWALLLSGWPVAVASDPASGATLCVDGGDRSTVAEGLRDTHGAGLLSRDLFRGMPRGGVHCPTTRVLLRPPGPQSSSLFFPGPWPPTQEV